MRTGKHEAEMRRRRFNAVWFALIVAAAAGAGVFAAWRAPALNLYAQDRLMRARGPLPEPDDIVVVAIDEQSIAKLGRFPWTREYSAQLIDKISSAEPKAIGLDVLYSEPSDDASADRALADSIGRARNVVIGEQLIENRSTPELARSAWLRSLPDIANSAAGEGHVNVETESDGSARELLLRLADDEGEPRWSLALEIVRVGDRLSTDQTTETSQFVRVGTRKIFINPIERNLFFKNQDALSRTTSFQPLRMTIDYIGPTGSFAAQTYSFADVLEGKVSPERFRGKYVLIGATAATLGDRIATPFVHAENADGDQHGDLMPGVEILANELNTILRNRFFQPVSELATVFLAALVALAVLTLLNLAQGKFEALKQIGVLAGLLALILIGSYLIFVHAFFAPPIVPMLASFIVAAPLALLRRSLAASVSLDERITELAAAGRQVFVNPDETFPIYLDGPRFDGDENLVSPAISFLKSLFLPRGLEWKTRVLGSLSADLINRAIFIDSALRSIEDGLLIADRHGRIAFANQSARRVFGLSERKLLGHDVFDLLAETENQPTDSINVREEMLLRLLVDRETIERESNVGRIGERRFYVLRMTAVPSARKDEDEREPLGIIVTLSDITQHRDLQQTKNDVIALVTHELRTPLTAIQGMSEVLAEHTVEPEPQRKMLQTINSEAKRLAQMINEYLDITRLEAGAQYMNLAPVNLESLIDRTLLMLGPLAARRDIKIVDRYFRSQTIVSADAGRLAQLLTNIFGNAVKYSAPNSSIIIETRTNNGMLEIIVLDEGCGISAEQLPHIFEKFYRVPQRGVEVSGTGLGLALAQEIAALHGGRITAESELGRGSTFTIHLPFVEQRANGKQSAT